MQSSRPVAADSVEGRGELTITVTVDVAAEYGNNYREGDEISVVKISPVTLLTVIDY